MQELAEYLMKWWVDNGAREMQDALNTGSVEKLRLLKEIDELIQRLNALPND